MQGVLDPFVRQLLTEVNEYDLCITEFVRVVDQLLPEKVFYRLCPELKNQGFTPSKTPVRVQLLGQHPNCLAENAHRAIELGSHGIDLNCGCPSKTVNGSNGGAALLKQPELSLLLDDQSADPVAKRDLLAKVLYGKVTAVTEALALQVIGRPERNAIDDVNALSEYAAALRGHKVAVVTSANALTKAQHQTLATKLEGIYAYPMSLHTEVDPSLIGGAIIRVGYEVIDGSTSGKIARLRAQLV